MKGRLEHIKVAEQALCKQALMAQEVERAPGGARGSGGRVGGRGRRAPGLGSRAMLSGRTVQLPFYLGERRLETIMRRVRSTRTARESARRPAPHGVGIRPCARARSVRLAAHALCADAPYSMEECCASR